MLLLSGYSDPFRLFGRNFSRIAGLHYNLIEISGLKVFKLHDLSNMLDDGYQGIHLHTNVTKNGIRIDDREVDAAEFFRHIDGFGLKFIFVDTCNSVWVVSQFRQTDIGALIAATENLSSEYADDFELRFYQELGAGAYVSQAFHQASAIRGKIMQSLYSTRSGLYNPMFLDLRVDSSFSESTI